MPLQMNLLRQLFLLTSGIGIAIAAVVVGGLAIGGAFSWSGFAHIILILALVVGVLEVVIVHRALRVTHVRGPLASWRFNEHTQGCSVALVVALIALGLLTCGGIVEWLVEWNP